jgi:hypothetical protein
MTFQPWKGIGRMKMKYRAILIAVALLTLATLAGHVTAAMETGDKLTDREPEVYAKGVFDAASCSANVTVYNSTFVIRWTLGVFASNIDSSTIAYQMYKLVDIGETIVVLCPGRFSTIEVNVSDMNGERLGMAAVYIPSK